LNEGDSTFCFRPSYLPGNDPTDQWRLRRLLLGGCLLLTSLSRSFEVIWSPLDSSLARHDRAVFRNLELPPTPWSFGQFLKSDSRDIDSISLAAGPDSFLLTVIPHGDRPPRTFRVGTDRFLAFRLFIGQLIANGLVVPTNTANHSLKFWSTATQSLVLETARPFIDRLSRWTPITAA
jgi:hypothetical protein